MKEVQIWNRIKNDQKCLIRMGSFFYSSDPDPGNVIPEEKQHCLGDEEAEKFLVSAGSLDFGHFEKVLKKRA
jgi:hypothetical protein